MDLAIYIVHSYLFTAVLQLAGKLTFLNSCMLVWVVLAKKTKYIGFNLSFVTCFTAYSLFSVENLNKRISFCEEFSIHYNNQDLIEGYLNHCGI